MSVSSESTTIYLITLFLLVATLNSIIALLVMVIAALCRIGQNDTPHNSLKTGGLYICSWILSALYFLAAYFGYGIFSLPVIMGVGKFSLKLSGRQTLLFTLLTGVLFVCLNIMLALTVFYLGGGMVLTNKLFMAI